MSYTPTTLIVQQLLKYLSENPDLKGAFEEAFKNAQKDHPWLLLWTEYDVHSLDNYFQYMDEFVHWVPTENRQGTDVYNHICFFYFILDTSPLREYQSTIHPSSRSPWTWLSDWLIKYAKEMGQWMDSMASFDPEQIQTFVESPAYRDKGVKDFYDQYPKPDGGWKTFNRFFARHINPKYRPIDERDRDDPTAILCPADCAFDKPCTWPVQDDSTVKLKGVPWSIRQLLDEGSVSDPYSPKFSGGVFTHAFLNTTNYHRLHTPVSGEVVEAKVIHGLCFLEVVAELKPGRTPIPGPGSERLVMRRPMLSKEVKTDKLEAPNSAGYQFLQARALVLIKSEIGLVAVLPIGMAQVSSVVLCVKKGDTVTKGQEFGYFQLGGSDIVMVFQKDANVDLKPENSDGEEFTKVHRKIGTATPVQGY